MTNFKKQPSRGVLNKRCSENIQQIYRRTPNFFCKVTKRRNSINPLRFERSFQISKLSKVKKIKTWK